MLCFPSEARSFDKLSYMAGGYAAGFDGDYNEWFDTSGGMFFLASIGYDMTGRRLDYSYTPRRGLPLQVRRMSYR